MTLQSEDMGKLVAVDPAIQGGEPCISGTRIPVRFVQSFHNAGYTAHQIANEYPSLNSDQINAAIAFRPAHREAQPETDGGGERIELTKVSEVMDLLRSRTDPMVKAMNRAQMDDACRVDLAYALIADRKNRAQPTPEGQTEGAVVTVPVDVVQRAIRWLRRPKNDLNSYAVADDLRAALASKGV